MFQARPVGLRPMEPGVGTRLALVQPAELGPGFQGASAAHTQGLAGSVSGHHCFLDRGVWGVGHTLWQTVTIIPQEYHGVRLF